MPAMPVPIERHQARGQNGKTLGKRDIEATEIVKKVPFDVPEPPDDLGTYGVAAWNRVWEAGYWLWPDQDVFWVEQIAYASEQVIEFRNTVKAEGLTVTGYNGQTVAHPLIAEQRKANAEIAKALSLLGFSPTDRARLKLTELKGEKTAQDILNNSKPGTQVVDSYVEDSW